eukprot:CAMPEP_0204322224 /NCGR_PEP_ID=MMETSP0469-20131031/8575_1 /ASSEMBLY_ACC=CAM_ASM_000384 /TAXON_ID=2969 /ORGANISM="Oxyrrhis marina" /LENGTH=165 /DNA_ID=CAMNT_0051303559 /DNA_START=42 /DNA_END=539 /DNA_ORIENTATION=-
MPFQRETPITHNQSTRHQFQQPALSRRRPLGSDNGVTHQRGTAIGVNSRKAPPLPTQPKAGSQGKEAQIYHLRADFHFFGTAPSSGFFPMQSQSGPLPMQSQSGPLVFPMQSQSGPFPMQSQSGAFSPRSTAADTRHIMADSTLMAPVFLGSTVQNRGFCTSSSP